MSEPWKPAIQIWPFKHAPEEFRRLSPWEEDGTEELLIYIPAAFAHLFKEDDWIMVMPPAFAFLRREPKREEHLQYAGDDFGRYSIHLLPDGSRIAITAESEWDQLHA
jgi:hypothetical protein